MTRSSSAGADLDAEMAASRAAFIKHYNATFDFEAGLDDVYRRAGIARPYHPAHGEPSTVPPTTVPRPRGELPA